jgi:hypothetical protein
MYNQRYAKLVVTVICLVISALALANTNLDGVKGFAKFTIPVFPQIGEREVHQERPNPKDPVELTEVKVQGKAVRIKEKFLEEDQEWIKKTEIKLKNKFSKTVTYIQVNIDFPETATSGIMFQEQLLLGRHPVYGAPKNQLPLNLKPGESLEVLLAPEFDRIKKMIESRHSPIGFINKILIRLQDVGFDDGTVYAAGAFFKKNPDTNSLRKWIQIEK